MEPTSPTDFRPHRGDGWPRWEPRPDLEPPVPASSALELTAYFHADERAGRRGLGRALLEEYARFGLRTSVLVECAEGFGRSRRVRSDRFEATWGGVPIVVTAADVSERMIGATRAVERLVAHGLVTLDGIELITEPAEPSKALGPDAAELAIHCRSGRGRDDPDGVGGVIEQLRRSGVSGATALTGREGTVAGEHRGSRVFLYRPDAPAIVLAVDKANALALAVPPLLALPQVELLTAKPIAICRYRGRRQDAIETSPDPRHWCKLCIYSDGEAGDGFLPAHVALEYRLRKAGARGVTVMRGRVGYALGAPLRPDRGWFPRRQFPMVTTIVDTSDRIIEWLELVDELTGTDGLVTCEPVTVVESEPT
jgi:PII-like signaling protein